MTTNRNQRVLRFGPGDPYESSDYRQSIDELFPLLNIRPGSQPASEMSLHTAQVDEVLVARLSGTSHSIQWSAGASPTSEFSYYGIGLQLSGSVTLAQGNRVSTVFAGDLSMCDAARPFDMHLTEDFSLVFVQIPKHALTIPQGMVDYLTADLLSGADGSGSVLAAYMQMLGEHLHLLASPAGSGLVRAFADLVSSTIEDRVLGDSSRLETSTAPLLQILAYIDVHLGDRDLGPSSIASAHHFSVRHLYNLFSPTGVGVSHWIKQRRLEATKRDFANPEYATDSLSMIANRWGFDDKSYFSHVFRQSFGMAPRNWRAQFGTDALMH